MTSFSIFHKIGLLLVVILFLFSCDDSKEFGLDLQSQDQLLKTSLTDTISIESETLLSERIATSKGSLMIGQMDDPKFGSIEAEVYAKILLSSDTAVRFVDARNRKPVYDSVSFVLNITKFHGDTFQGKNVEVYRLLEDLDTSKVYYSDDRIPSGELLGSTKITKKSGNVYNIRLKDSFGKFLFDKQGTVDFANQKNFESFFTGVRIRMSDRGTFHELVPYTTGIKLYYHFEGDTATGDRLKKEHTFRIVRAVADYNGNIVYLPDRYQFFNNIKTDFSKTPFLRNIATQKAISSKNTNDELYIQGGSDLKAFIKFPFLDKMNLNGNIFVNRAELVFNIQDETFNVSNQTPPDLIFLEADEGKNILTQDGKDVAFSAEGSASPLVVSYNSTGRNYPDVLLTSYVQDIMRGKRKNNGLIIRTNGHASSVRKVLLNASKSGKNALKLKLYYTIIKK